MAFGQICNSLLQKSHRKRNCCGPWPTSRPGSTIWARAEMNAQRLLQHFERISEAPDAVPRLRRFILDLAVRGKLVEQDPGDEPASELLKRIRAEKVRLVKAGEIRKERPLPLVEEDEAPYSSPTGWEWVRIRQVTSDRGQITPDKDFTYIDVTAINKEVGCVADAKVLSPLDAPSRARKMVRTGDVLYSCVRPYLLNIAVIEWDMVPSPIASTAFAVLNGFGLVLSKYLWIALRSPFMIECVEAKMRGQAYPAINDSDFAILPLPLPPLAEQHRIVVKVDELMALCDRLETAQAERESRRDRLAAASLHRLNNGTDVESFRENTRFHLRYVPRLTTRTEHIQRLRQTILNLAVRGKLVPQDPRDEAASKLLKRIQTEKEKLIQERKIRRHDPLPPIGVDDEPFSIPESWEWSRLGTVCFVITDGAHHTPKYQEEGIPFLSVKDVSGGTIDFSRTRFISETAHRELCGRCMPEFGDILLTKVGTTGIAVTVDVDKEFSIFVSLALLKFSEPNLDRRYLRHLINSPFVKQQSADNTQGIGNKNLVLRLINQFVIPLPPLAEQRRIVAKVEDLMAVCDRLEVQIGTTATNTRQLLEATLRATLLKVQRHASEIKRGDRPSPTEVGNELPRSSI